MATSILTLIFNQKGAKRTTRSVVGLGVALATVGFIAKRMGGFLVQASDSYTQLQNRTKVFANGQKDANIRMAGAIRIARKMNGTIEESAGIMQRIAIAQKTAGFSTEQLIKITENLTQASLLSGATTQESEGALRQFAQGMAANRLAGQELNSVLEQTPLVAVALARGLTKMGKHGIVAAGDLRRLAEAGELTTEVLVKIFGEDIPELEAMFKKFSMPIERIFTSVKREINLLVGQMAQLTSANDTVRGAMNKVVEKLAEFNTWLMAGGPEVDAFLEKVRLLAYAVGAVVLVAAIGLAIAGFIALAGVLATGGALGTAMVAGVGLMWAMKESTFQLGEETVSTSALLGALYDEVFKPEDGRSWLTIIIDGFGNKFGKVVAGATVLIDVLSKVYEWFKLLGKMTDITELERQVKFGRDSMGRVIDRTEVKAKIKEYNDDLDAMNTAFKERPSMGEVYAGVLEQIADDGGVINNVISASETIAASAKEAAAVIIGDTIISAAAATTKAMALIKADADARAAKYAADIAAANELAAGIADENTASELAAKKMQQLKAIVDAATTDFNELRASQDKVFASEQALAEGMAVISKFELLTGKTDLAIEAMRLLYNAHQDVVRAEGEEDRKIIEEKIEDYRALVGETNNLAEAQKKYIEGLAIIEEAREIGHISAEQELLDRQQLLAVLEATVAQEMFDKLEGMPALMAGAQKGVNDFVESMGSPAELMAGGFTSALNMASDAITEFVTTGKLDFKKFARDMVNMILKVIIQLLILKAIQAATGMGGGVPSSGGGIPIKSASSMGKLTMPSMTSGYNWGSAGRAMGGPVASGQPVMVGEKGPEMFVPPSGGSIKSNSALAGAKVQNNIKIVNIDDPKSIPAAMATAEGEEVIVNVISRNSDVLREII